MDYRYSSHTLFQMKYHFVRVTKYRYKVLSGEIHPTPPLTLAEKTQN
jgi:REP element-mobilizing transposase RayT